MGSMGYLVKGFTSNGKESRGLGCSATPIERVCGAARPLYGARTAEGDEELRGIALQVSDNRGRDIMKAGMAKGMSLAFEFAGAVFLFWFLGRLVDNWLGIEPWGQVVGAVVGWIGGTLHVFYAMQRGTG